jgi:DNA-binding XRE family transcriptional regulator
MSDEHRLLLPELVQPLAKTVLFIRDFYESRRALSHGVETIENSLRRIDRTGCVTCHGKWSLIFAVAKFNRMPPRAKKAPEAIAFGAAVRERREAKGWTQERLAEVAGVSALQIGFCERGDNVPKLTLILRIARALGVRPGELLDDIKTPKR